MPSNKVKRVKAWAIYYCKDAKIQERMYKDGVYFDQPLIVVNNNSQSKMDIDAVCALMNKRGKRGNLWKVIPITISLPSPKITRAKRK